MKFFNAGRVAFFALTLVSMFALSGCKKENPNPELLDPIYSDLEKRASEAQKSFEDQAKKIEDAQNKLEKAEPNSIELKNAQRDLIKARHASEEFEQKARYFKIRAQRRLLVDRITYKQRFAKNEPWPDPHEYSDYLLNIRLREVPLNWAARVPKLNDRLAKSSHSDQKEEKKESKSEE